jgi:two-component system OmpR family response regulator
MRLLLVEDDHRVARFIKKGLEAERYQVSIATNGQEGIDMGLTEMHDLILLDVVLPIKGGIDVCRELRGQGIKTPILMLTAKDSIDDKVEGFGAGADDYLTKPFAFEELVARVQALLRRPQELDIDPVLQVADLTLDRNTHEVRRAGEPISLTHTEFQLLTYFMQRPGRVLSRPMIEERVWDHHHDHSTNVVDVYVRRLRTKIDQGSGQELIQTVRGVGYVLKA